MPSPPRLTRLAIARAVPAGSRRPPRKPGAQPAYLAALAQDPELAARRGDFQHNVMALARIYARHVDWQDMTTWRPREDICAEIGSPRDRSKPLSVTAYRAARRWLQEHGYLGLVAAGWTSALRAAALDDGEKTCPVYVLAIPRIPKTRHIPLSQLPVPPVNRALTTSRSDVVKAPARARSQTEQDQGQDRNGPRCARAACVPQAADVGPADKTQIRSEGLAAAAVILNGCRPLRPLSPEHVAALTRRFTAVRWTPGGVLWAIGHEPPQPDGRCREHGYAQDVRNPAAWLRYRLSLWLTPDGTPLPDPAQRGTAQPRRARAQQAARQAQWQQTQQARATGSAYDAYDRGAAQARAQLTPRPGRTTAPVRPSQPAPVRSAPPAAAPANPAELRQNLLSRLDASALARAQRHRARTATRLAGPAQAAAVRTQTAPQELPIKPLEDDQAP